MTAALAVLLALAATAGSAVDLSFEPRAGDVWRTSFEQRLELRLDEVSLAVRKPGERGDPFIWPGGVEWSSTRSLLWTDEYVSVDAERAQRVRRGFERLATREHRREEGASRFGAVSYTDEDSSALVGKTIRFDWDAELDDYRAAAEPFEYVDRDQLDALRVDVDSAGVLPRHRVDIGDSWTIGPDMLQQLVRPGGRVPFETLGASVFDEFLAASNVATLDGAPRVVLVDVERRDDGEIARLRVEGRLEGRTEPQDSSAITLLGVAVPTLRSTSLAFELEGEIEWDVSAHHVSRVDLTARVEIVRESVNRRADVDWEWRSTETWRGELAIEQRATR